MLRFTLPIVLLLLFALAAGCPAIAREAVPAPDLPFEKYVLPNGLQVILHRDETLPVAAVNVWYHVGSGNESPDRTGIAHLFEHMMFQGSVHHDREYFPTLQKMGAHLNAMTNKDRTLYWEDVPADQLELALWLEADRMGFLLGAMTQERLDVQRGVVLNEMLETRNEPYAAAEDLLQRLMFPPGHPYSWPVIGREEHVRNLTREDLADFFRQYYVPSNASLCVAGSFDPIRVKTWIEEYFGTLPPGPPAARLETWLPVLDGERRAVAEDEVELPRLTMSWHTPARYRPGDAEFDLLAVILGRGKDSRLHRALVRERSLAQKIDVRQESRALGSTFTIEVTAVPGVEPAELEAALDAELGEILARDVGDREIEVARAAYEAGFFRKIEELGGLNGRANLLNHYNVLCGDPGYLPRDLQRYRDVTGASLRAWANHCLQMNQRAVLTVLPRDDVVAVGEGPADRSVMPAGSDAAPFTPPRIRTAVLDNGLRLNVVERRNLPLVQAHLVIKSGWSADPDGKPGVAAMTADMLDEGAAGRDALEIAGSVEEMGAKLTTGSNFDGSFVTLDILRTDLADGLRIVRDLVLDPDLPSAECRRMQQAYLARQKAEEAEVRAAAIKELQVRLFGSDHPYAQPYTGTGTPESVAAITREDLQKFHEYHYCPGNAEFVLVGDIGLAEAEKLLAEVFGKWRGEAPPRAQPRSASARQDPALVILDRPGSVQSLIVGGCVGLSRAHADRPGFLLLNHALGGQFTSRLNLNLREEKGWSYGARSRLTSYRDEGFFLVSASVETGHTAVALTELRREVAEIGTTRPLQGEELVATRESLIRGFPQRFRNLRSVAGTLDRMVMTDMPRVDWDTFVDRVTDCSQEDLLRITAEHLDPDRMVWVIVGDEERIRADLATGKATAPDPASGESDR